VLVAWTPSGTLPDATVLRHVAAATALHQTRLYAERERSRRLGASLLSQLLDQRIAATAARRPLAAAGLGSTDLILAACADASEQDDLHLLHHQLGDSGVHHLMLARPPLTYVLLRAEPASIEALTEGLAEGTSVGLSDPVSSPADLPTAERQARWALHRAQERRLAVLHHSDDLGDSVFLPGDREDSRAAARRVLGSVLEYDEAHATRLMDSLRAFLEENRSWQKAAQRLHIHKQTLVYRMRRVEDLTSRSLFDTADVADMWLALQAATASGLVDR
jgi:PucR family transcriptional regulator, purine catabolism regulatory protein